MKSPRPEVKPSFKVVLSNANLGKINCGEVCVDWSLDQRNVASFTIGTKRKMQRVQIFCVATGTIIMEHICASPSKFIMDLQFENVPGACEYVLYGYYLGSST